MAVNSNTRLRVNAASRPEIAAALVAARKKLGLNQTELAQALGSSQGAVSRWERQIDSPPASAFVVMSNLVPEIDRGYWLQLAGIAPPPASPRQAKNIPVLHDAAAAGTPRAIDEHEFDFYINVPAELLPSGGKLYGIRVAGDSMSPVLEEGFIVVVDVTRRDPGKLNGKMIAARHDAAITIKWLRKQGSTYLLIPQNQSPRHPVAVMDGHDDYGIVGEVLCWLGFPPE